MIKMPNALIALITLKCSLRCRMCRLWQNDENVAEYVSEEEWFRFLKELQGNVPDDFNVIFGGGEPLLFSEKLFKLISCAKSLGFRTSLATSGINLDKDKILSLRDAGLDYCALSVYSLNNRKHDYLRGTKGLLKNVKRSIKLFSKYAPGVELAIDTVIMKPNLRDMPKLTKWVIRNKRVSKMMFQAVMQPFHTKPEEEWFANKEFQEFWPDDLRLLDNVIGKLKKLKAKDSQNPYQKINNPIEQFDVFQNYFHEPNKFIKADVCSTLKGDMVGVMPNGNVTICPYMEPIGNIKNASLEKILDSEASDKRKNQIKMCSQNCHHIVNCWYQE